MDDNCNDVYVGSLNVFSPSLDNYTTEGEAEVRVDGISTTFDVPIYFSMHCIYTSNGCSFKY